MTANKPIAPAPLWWSSRHRNLMLGCCVIVASVGCGRSSAPTAESLPDVVFVCRESGEVFVGSPRATPVTHPVTQQPTLMPGLYDPRQKHWVVGPPLEVQQRSANKPQAAGTRSKLERTGPIPTTAIPLDPQ